ncbi:hypothetical protein Clacol_003230 [Clathrus columnatus]|uniref:T6SS Phospholipase effector Tle1-like catalytic domain-containing protein n=1 Tax=Clathrus columnatus TaxID=1419009 RepID=A0AAV5A8E5_9AGAM|nr:hypothetical protein Clacol_003230 [Clathrus columnatus]
MKFSILNINSPQQAADGSDTIPASSSSRTLNSNVVRFVSLLAKNDQTQQMTGIGTFTYRPMIDPLKAKLLLLLDKIGAYIVRALAGMLNKVGLLSAGNHREVPFAYAMYVDTSQIGWEQSSAFKRTFCRSVDIDFVGVWYTYSHHSDGLATKNTLTRDTVSSLGFFVQELPLCSFNPSIKVLRHAIALDERRVAFNVNCFVSESEVTGGYCQRERRRESELKTDCLEVRFAGSHTDVGGGGVMSDSRHSLSRCSLRWMIRQCFLTNTGLRFYHERLTEVGLNPSTLHPLVLDFPNPALYSRSVSSRSFLDGPTTSGTNMYDAFPFNMEINEDIVDVSQPIVNDLRSTPLWWILEILPRPFISKVFGRIPIILFR